MASVRSHRPLPAAASLALLLGTLAPAAACGGAAQAVGPGPASAGTTAKPVVLAARLEPGIALAQGCEAEIDADFSHYARCIDAALTHHRERLGATARAGLLFQAWLMADLGVQQDSAGADGARQRWWAALQRNLRASRLELDALSEARGLDAPALRLRIQRAHGPQAASGTGPSSGADRP